MALVELLWEKDWEDMEVAVGPEGREPLPFNMCCVERVECSRCAFISALNALMCKGVTPL
jgi:hypothetical protein